MSHIDSISLSYHTTNFVPIYVFKVAPINVTYSASNFLSYVTNSLPISVNIRFPHRTTVKFAFFLSNIVSKRNTYSSSNFTSYYESKNMSIADTVQFS